MHAIYAFGLLILLSYLGTRFMRRARNSFSPLALFFHSGLTYVILGLYLGPHGSNILSSDILAGFRPLIALGLGWLGFMFGFQLEYRYLKRFPRKYISLSFLLFITVFALVTTPMIWIFERWFDYPRFYMHGAAGALGLLAGIHSPTLMSLVSPLLSKRGHHYYLARFLVSVGGFWGLLGMVLLASFWQYPFFDQSLLSKGIILFGISTLVPVLLGYLFHKLTENRVPEQDLLVYLLGMVFFVSGAAFYFNLLPLYVCMVLGIVFSNLTRKHERIYPLLISTEKPLFLILLILVGALWEINLNLRILVLVVLLLGLRLSSHMLSMPLLSRLLRFPFKLPFSFGLSLLSSGGLGIAFAASLFLAYPMELTNIFLSVALFAIFAGEFLSPLAIKISLYRTGRVE